jgi:hypothetical protein
MGQPPTTRAGWASCPGRSAARSDALQTPISGLPEIGTLMGKPDLRGPPQPLAVPDQRCTTRCRSRCIASGTHDLSHLANLNQHTPPRSRGAFSAPELLPLSFAHSDRGVGGAPRDVRVFARHPSGSPRCPLSLRFGRAADRSQRAPRTQVVVPGGRGPASRGDGHKPPPQDATPRSAFRMPPDDAPY